MWISSYHHKFFLCFCKILSIFAYLCRSMWRVWSMWGGGWGDSIGIDWVFVIPLELTSSIPNPATGWSRWNWLRLSHRLAPAILRKVKYLQRFESELSSSEIFYFYVIPKGFKPLTFRTGIWRSIQLSYGTFLTIRVRRYEKVSETPNKRLFLFVFLSESKFADYPQRYFPPWGGANYVRGMRGLRGLFL